MTPTQSFVEARNLLFKHRTDYEAARREFRWPSLTRFNWARDWFDVLAKDNKQTALFLVDEAGKEEKLSFAELSERSSRLAAYLRRLGLSRGDRLLTMLPNAVPLWELLLAAMKLGAVVIPATALLTREDLEDRVARGGVKLVATDLAGAEKWEGVQGSFARLLCGAGSRAGWQEWSGALAQKPLAAVEDTLATDPLLLYFTSGTTAKPKLVQHTQQSYPVGHLSTMYWIGLREGDVHWNISSPGWAKHAWSSFFAPWNAGATIFMREAPRFNARATLDAIAKHAVTTLCAPPTVWRMLTLEPALAELKGSLREVVGAGEPLNPEVIERVQKAWGLTLRDGYGQTETTAQIGNSPGQPVRPGSMGRALPGYDAVLLDPDGAEGNEGEISLRLTPRPVGLMDGYRDDPELSGRAFAGGYYRTGDVAARDEAGYFHYVGRADDVFKSSDYRISPFELESVLIEHPAVAEAAIVESPDPVRGTVPKAFVVLRAGQTPSRDLARDILKFCRGKLAPFKRIRRLQFAELPKTISGKIRRVQLRLGERDLRKTPDRAPNEHWDEDFPELKGN